MGKMIDGKWTTQWYKSDGDGAFQRPDTVFRGDGVTDESTAEQFHLYISYACPWAHRTLIARNFLGIENELEVSVVAAFMGDDGWTFETDAHATGDRLFGSKFMHEIYSKADPSYTGRVTVPVLWDKEKQTIVNNESIEIVRMLDRRFSTRSRTLFPADLSDTIDETIAAIYNPINNGVYRCGFATSQSAYEKAYNELFEALDHWEEVLSTQRFLCGEHLTAADICMFTTLVRFDAVYHTHFKTNRSRIVDFPNLWGFVREIYQMDFVRPTVCMSHIKSHYFASHETINPTRIIAAGPAIDFDLPHHRS